MTEKLRNKEKYFDFQDTELHELPLAHETQQVAIVTAHFMIGY